MLGISRWGATAIKDWLPLREADESARCDFEAPSKQCSLTIADLPFTAEYFRRVALSGVLQLAQRLGHLWNGLRPVLFSLHFYVAHPSPIREQFAEALSSKCIMMTVRITEAELARNLHAVLEKVQQGSEVIVEREDHRPVAIIRSPHRSGRPITEILRDAEESNSTVTLDKDFGRDLEQIIATHQQPWNPPSWD